jgi:hypothetical protein
MAAAPTVMGVVRFDCASRSREWRATVGCAWASGGETPRRAGEGSVGGGRWMGRERLAGRVRSAPDHGPGTAGRSTITTRDPMPVTTATNPALICAGSVSRPRSRTFGRCASATRSSPPPCAQSRARASAVRLYRWRQWIPSCESPPPPRRCRQGGHAVAIRDEQTGPQGRYRDDGDDPGGRAGMGEPL